MIICPGVDTGIAMGVVKIRAVRSVRHKRSANCWRIPAITISYLSELWKVQHSGAISKSCLLLSLRIVLEPFIYLLRAQNASTVGH